jgi:polyhydroxybutyrate depolymerase
MTLGIDDVAFLDAVVRDAKLRPEVDPDRVYMVGESNGGIMTYRYLCDHADRLAGAASVLGTNQAGCVPNSPLPLLHIAGTADEVIPYDGGLPLGSRIASGGDFPPLRDTLDTIAASFGCDPRPVTEPRGPVERTEWERCDGDVPLRLDSVLGGTHLWPKGDDYRATDVVLDFFGITPA